MRKQLSILFGLAIIISLAAIPFQNKPISWWGFPEPMKLIVPDAAFATETASPDSAFAPADNVYKISFAQVSGLYIKRKKTNVHFLDARDPKLYDEGHIPGAVNIPWEKIADYRATLDTLPKADLYVVYCDGGDCHLSHDLSGDMLQNGWKRLACYEGGWAEWSLETDFIEKKGE
jgi:3-mercaptopyruvate sulfurtransferase SseA